MKKYGNINSFFSRDRKTLYIILSIVMISVLTLTIVYAALSTTLNINGNAEVSAASWDIHLDNVVLNNRSATTAAPAITDPKTVAFSTTLSKPGDFYEFTIDVVNNGTIDAMIDSVTKTPELNASQSKYLNYIVEYQNGEPITTKQLVSKKSFVRLKVKVEFRKDITASDLPTSYETLNLAFRVNYTQSDSTAINVPSNGKSIKVISGSLSAIGSEVAIGDEHFYVIESKNNKITLFAKYNLHVGNQLSLSDDFEEVLSFGPIPNPTKKQSPSAIGWNMDSKTFIGIVEFSNESYWWDEDAFDIDSKYEKDTYNRLSYVYDRNSSIYNYIEEYKIYIESLGVEVEEARLIRTEDLTKLGCSMEDNSCANAEPFVFNTSYWTGMALYEWIVPIDKHYDNFGNSAVNCYNNDSYGIRPVIVINYGYADIADLGEGSYKIGTEFCFGKECFYVIDDDSEKVTMLAKYNLYAGGEKVNREWVSYGNEATGIQDPTMLGWSLGTSQIRGTINFSSTSYWNSTNNYPAYIYNSNSEIYKHVENYKTYLINHGVQVAEARLITAEELEALGCVKESSCPSERGWIATTSYWTGTAESEELIWILHRYSGGGFFTESYIDNGTFGIRPVISILKS